MLRNVLQFLVCLPVGFETVNWMVRYYQIDKEILGACRTRVSEEMSMPHLHLLGGILVLTLEAFMGNGKAVLLPEVIETMILSLTGTQVTFTFFRRLDLACFFTSWKV